jgi:hypothetical protein
LYKAEGDLIVLLPHLSVASLAAIPALVAPLLERGDLELVKGYSPGSRGSELSRLVGAPLINLHHPELAGFVDPLSGFVAARSSLLKTLPFPVGSGVDASLLLDSARLRGISSLAQAEIPAVQERYPVHEEDSYAVINVFLSRIGGLPQESPESPSSLVVPNPAEADFDSRKAPIQERPPLGELVRT